MSRTVFALRFKAVVGETATEYLTRWRMLLATERLSAGDEPVATIASALGYESESSFGKAFRRVIGHPPRRFARRAVRSAAVGAGCRIGPRHMDHVTEFCEAIWKRDAPTIARLVSRIDPNGEDRFGESALHRVADLRRAKGAKAARVATLLIERGAPVDARNRDAVTPLHQAVRARSLAVVEVLLDHGADPNAADKRGSTPLHRASSSTGAGGTAGIDPAPFVELLLARGADLKPSHR